jgi:ATP phosphoribosyltransferase regulatory subunit HisZ
VQVKTALVRNVDPNVVDVDAAVNAFGLGETERAQLRRLFARSDEVRYSGAHNGAGTISPQDRDEVLELIENLRA